MRDWNYRRVFRCLICLILICALLVNVSPIRARADAVSGTLAITSAAGVTISAPMVVAAALLVLGVGYVTDSDFQRVVNDCVIGLGDFVVDGSISLVQTVDSLGKTTYYVGCDVLEAIRGWLFDSDVLLGPSVKDPYASFDNDSNSSTYSLTDAILRASRADSYAVLRMNDGTIRVYYAGVSGVALSGYPVHVDNKYIYTDSSDEYYWTSDTGMYFRCGAQYLSSVSSYSIFKSGDTDIVLSNLDLTLKSIPTVPIDGTSARAWAPAYANRGLYVVPGSGTGGNEGQDGKWFWPLAFGLTAGVLGAMSQAEHWTAETPPEFSEYEEKEEYEVTPAPEFEGYPSIEIKPVTNPDVDPGGGSDATEPEDPDSTSPTTPGYEGGGETGETPDFPDLGGGEFPGTKPDPGTGTDPDPEPDPDPNPNPDPDPGTDPDSGTSSWTPSGPMGNFALDLKNYFPFCIPFDLYAFFTCLNADPVAPVIDWIIPMPGGGSYPFQIDLSVFNPVAQTLRRLQLLLFCVGLAFKTRDLIKG